MAKKAIKPNIPIKQNLSKQTALRLLAPRQDAVVMAQQLSVALSRAGIRATIMTKDNKIELTSNNGDRVALRTKVSNPSASQLALQYEGTASGQTFNWKVIISRDDALTFKKFIKTGSAINRNEINKLAVELGREPTADDTDPDDTLFCTVLGGILAAGSGAGGVAVGALCLWFASNGLDEEEEEGDDTTGGTGGED